MSAQDKCPRCQHGIGHSPAGITTYVPDVGIVHVACMTQGEILNQPIYALRGMGTIGLSDETVAVLREVMADFDFVRTRAALDLHAIARSVDALVPEGAHFTVLVWTNDAEGPGAHYASNALREGVVKAMRETADRIESGA